MLYGYWKSGSQDKASVFELFFRNNPFNGGFTIFAGLNECISYLNQFKFSETGSICLHIYIK